MLSAAIASTHQPRGARVLLHHVTLRSFIASLHFTFLRTALLGWLELRKQMSEQVVTTAAVTRYYTAESRGDHHGVEWRK